MQPPAEDVPATKSPPFITNAVLFRFRTILLLVFQAGTLVNPNPDPVPDPNPNPNKATQWLLKEIGGGLDGRYPELAIAHTSLEV